MKSTTLAVSRWPKRPPLLTPEQERAREAFMALWHQQLPSRYQAIEHFNHGFPSRLPIAQGSRTLEIGAGLGAHAAFEDLTRQDYYFQDYREEFCSVLRTRFPADHVSCGDIEQRQDWPDGFFDRIVAVHVLEHLRNLPAALSELRRLLTPNGVLDVVLPCEGGWAYALARKISAERLFRRRFGMDYTPIVRNEHVSTLSEILEEIDRLFEIRVRSFFPLRVPVATLNLCVGLRAVPRQPTPR